MDCHCNECGWEGDWEDCDITTTYEERGDMYGSRVQAEITAYSCPLCDAEVESGPAPINMGLLLDNLDDEDDE